METQKDDLSEANIRRLVGLFQCPGCVAGSDPSCGRYEYDLKQLRCIAHVIGTHIGLGNPVALGMPKGFNRPGWTQEGPGRNMI